METIRRKEMTKEQERKIRNEMARIKMDIVKRKLIGTEKQRELGYLQGLARAIRIIKTNER